MPVRIVEKKDKGHKIFVSYKYADSDVFPLFDKENDDYDHIHNQRKRTIVRNYVDILEEKIKEIGSIYKGEPDGYNLKPFNADSTIWEKLKDKIFGSSVTVFLISPNMVERWTDDGQPIPEDDQWIPNEISYSLRKDPRNGRVSQRNALVGVILPDSEGSYDYAFDMDMFDLVKRNIDKGYVEIVKWHQFIEHIDMYVEFAIKRRKYIAPDVEI